MWSSKKIGYDLNLDCLSSSCTKCVFNVLEIGVIGQKVTLCVQFIISPYQINDETIQYVCDNKYFLKCNLKLVVTLNVAASGEPPLLLASSVFSAIRNAITAARKDYYGGTLEHDTFQFDQPATMDKVKKLCGFDNVERHLRSLATTAPTHHHGKIAWKYYISGSTYLPIQHMKFAFVYFFYIMNLAACL